MPHAARRVFREGLEVGLADLVAVADAIGGKLPLAISCRTRGLERESALAASVVPTGSLGDFTPRALAAKCSEEPWSGSVLPPGPPQARYPLATLQPVLSVGLRFVAARAAVDDVAAAVHDIDDVAA